MTTLKLQNLSLIREQRVLAHELELSIVAGDCWGILGPNGCGKSTLLHALCGQFKAAAGAIRVNERSIASLATREVAQHIGILFQDSHFTFPQTVYEYCHDALYPRQSLSRGQGIAEIQTALQKLDLAHLQHKNIQNLSGGEKRRAAIAALLVQAPQIYLLDEPNNHLDLSHQMQIMQFFAHASRDKAVVMSLHDINLAARFCNKLLLMYSNGTIMHGPTASLLTSQHLSALYRYPIDALIFNDQTYWQPRLSPNQEEPSWEFVY